MTKAKLGHGKDEMFSLQAQIGTSQKLVHLCGRKKTVILSNIASPVIYGVFLTWGYPQIIPKLLHQWENHGKPMAFGCL